MASTEAIELIDHLSRLLRQREYKARPGSSSRRASWHRKYRSADLAIDIDNFAYRFHAQRLSDAGFDLVPKKDKAA